MPITDSNPTSENPQTQASQNVQNAAPLYPQQFEDDTIDLYELFITLWNKKGLVIVVTVIAALGSVVYALQQPSIYKAEALLLPPGAKDIQSLNIPGLLGTKRMGVKVMEGINPKNVFAMFKQNLSSRTLQKKFILENDLMAMLAPEGTAETGAEEIYAVFAGLIQLGDENGRNVNGSTSVSIEMYDAEIASQWVNDFVNFIDAETISLVAENVRNSIANQIRDIEYSIASKRELVKNRRKDQIDEIERTIKSKRKIAERRRTDKIVRYEEAAKTAKILGIRSGLTQQTKLVEPTSTGRGEVKPLTSRDKWDSPINQMNVDIATATTPLFFIGYDALEAELKNLEVRSNEDPFIPGLRDLQEDLNRLNSISSSDSFISGLRDFQEQLALLRSIKIEEDKLHAVKIDLAAFPPKYPIKPNRRLIVSLGTVVGLFLGIFLVFFVSFVQKQKEIHSK